MHNPVKQACISTIAYRNRGFPFWFDHTVISGRALNILISCYLWFSIFGCRIFCLFRLHLIGGANNEENLSHSISNHTGVIVRELLIPCFLSWLLYTPHSVVLVPLIFVITPINTGNVVPVFLHTIYVNLTNQTDMIDYHWSILLKFTQVDEA